MPCTMIFSMLIAVAFTSPSLKTSSPGLQASSQALQAHSSRATPSPSELWRVWEGHREAAEQRQLLQPKRLNVKKPDLVPRTSLTPIFEGKYHILHPK